MYTCNKHFFKEWKVEIRNNILHVVCVCVEKEWRRRRRLVGRYGWIDQEKEEGKWKKKDGFMMMVRRRAAVSGRPRAAA